MLSDTLIAARRAWSSSFGSRAESRLRSGERLRRSVIETVYASRARGVSFRRLASARQDSDARWNANVHVLRRAPRARRVLAQARAKAKDHTMAEMRARRAA